MPLAVLGLGLLVVATASVRGQELLVLDDFADGLVSDGQPTLWTHSSGRVDASGGDLELSSSGRFSTYLEGYGSPHNVSLQTQVNFSQLSGNRDGIALFARSAEGAYWGELTTDGLLAFGEIDTNGQVNTWRIQSTSLNPIRGDVLLEFNAIEDQIDLTAWPVGGPRPASPQLHRANVTRRDGGRLGVSFLPNAAGGARQATAVLRYVFAHDGRATEADLIAIALQQGSQEARFDLNGDGRLTAADRDYWVDRIAQLSLGDSNRDGVFDSGDLVAVFAAGGYEDEIPDNAIWATGDWNGDRDFDSGDLVAAFERGGYEQGRTAHVPEPMSITIFLLGALALPLAARTRARREAVRSR